LVTRANKLSDMFSWLGNKTRDYNEALEFARKWLDETEPKVTEMSKELIGAEPKMVDQQLFKAKSLNNNIISNEKLIFEVEQAAANLFSSLSESQFSVEEKREIERSSQDLQARYKSIHDAISYDDSYQ
jgi:hypothetical protein